MKKIVFFYLFLPILFFTSCKPWEEEERNEEERPCRVYINWNRSTCLKLPSIASLYCYSQEEEGGFYMFTLTENPQQVFLPIGEYQFILFNGIEDDFPKLSFENRESLGNFTLVPNPYCPYYYHPSPSETYVYACENMVWAHGEIVFSEEEKEKEIELTPIPITNLFQVWVRVSHYEEVLECVLALLEMPHKFQMNEGRGGEERCTQFISLAPQSNVMEESEVTLMGEGIGFPLFLQKTSTMQVRFTAILKDKKSVFDTLFSIEIQPSIDETGLPLVLGRQKGSPLNIHHTYDFEESTFNPSIHSWEHQEEEDVVF